MAIGLNSNIIILTIVIILGITITLYSSTDIEYERLPVKGVINDVNFYYVKDFRMPKYIPDGYELYDSSISNKRLELYYAPINRDNLTMNIMTNIIFIADKNRDNTCIDRGIECFYDIKEKSQRGDKMQIFEINGNPAMGWEAGKKNTILMFDNGTRRVINEVGYPSSISMIDIDEQVKYHIYGNVLPLEELKKMMTSIYQ